MGEFLPEVEPEKENQDSADRSGHRYHPDRRLEQSHEFRIGRNADHCELTASSWIAHSSIIRLLKRKSSEASRVLLVKTEAW
jgi:hypothetical protein